MTEETRKCISCEKPEPELSRLLHGPGAIAICDRCIIYSHEDLLDSPYAYREPTLDIDYIQAKELWALITTERFEECEAGMRVTHALLMRSVQRRRIAYRSSSGMRLLFEIDSCAYPSVLPASIARACEVRLLTGRGIDLMTRSRYEGDEALRADLARRTCSFCGVPGRVPWITLGPSEHAHICCPCALLAYDMFVRDGPMPTVVIKDGGWWKGTSIERRQDERDDD
jgi:hypothetical protein